MSTPVFIERERKSFGEVAVITVAYIAIAAWNLDAPGLYMDAVNPDYMAVMLAQPPGHVPGWLLPDNALPTARHLPLLSSLYGGTLPAYFGYAVWSLTGYSLASVRGLHVVFGLLIALLSFTVARLCMSRRAALLAILVLIALPSFWLSWRTQFYLQLFPHLFFLPALSIALIDAAEAKRRRRAGLAVAAGFLFGLAGWAYFIFAIYFGAIFLACAWSRPRDSCRLCLLFAGFLLGYLPFLFAHSSIAGQVGWEEYLRMLGGLRNTYGLLDGQSVGFGRRILIALERLGHILIGSTLRQTIMGEPLKWSLAAIFIGSLAILPAVALFWESQKSPWRRVESEAMRHHAAMLFAAPVLAHVLLAVALGPSMLRQHYFPLLPLLILSGAVVVSTLTPAFRAWATVLAIALLSVATLMLHQALAATGGRGFYSDVINQAGAVIGEEPRETVLLFPQWGYWMGVVLLTGGNFRTVEAASIEALPLPSVGASGERFILVAPLYEPSALFRHFEDATGIAADRTIAITGIATAANAVDGKLVAQRLGLRLVRERIVTGTTPLDRLLILDLVKD